MSFSVITKGQVLANSIVVDNSVMMRWLFNDGSEKDKQYAQDTFDYIRTNKLQIIVPYIWVYEASFVVSFYTNKGNISTKESLNHLNSLFDLCLVIRGEETPKELYEFSTHHKLSSYDSSYTMLAVNQSSLIATLDKEIIRAAKGLNLIIFKN